MTAHGIAVITDEQIADVMRAYADDLPGMFAMPPLGATIAVPDTDLYGPVIGYDFTRYGDAYVQLLTSEGLILVDNEAL